MAQKLRSIQVAAVLPLSHCHATEQSPPATQNLSANSTFHNLLQPSGVPCYFHPSLLAVVFLHELMPWAEETLLLTDCFDGLLRRQAILRRARKCQAVMSSCVERHPGRHRRRRQAPRTTTRPPPRLCTSPLRSRHTLLRRRAYDNLTPQYRS